MNVILLKLVLFFYWLKRELFVSVVGSMVIIEIADSDDDMPTRKRVLSKDDDEDVRPTKKSLSKFLEELTDMPDGSDSSDSGDSSSSGSDIDSKREIARLCRKVSGINYGQLKLK